MRFEGKQLRKGSQFGELPMPLIIALESPTYLHLRRPNMRGLRYPENTAALVTQSHDIWVLSWKSLGLSNRLRNRVSLFWTLVSKHKQQPSAKERGMPRDQRSKITLYWTFSDQVSASFYRSSFFSSNFYPRCVVRNSILQRRRCLQSVEIQRQKLRQIHFFPASLGQSDKRLPEIERPWALHSSGKITGGGLKRRVGQK